MPRASQCLRGIWTVPLIIIFNFWSVLKCSDIWTTWLLQIPLNCNDLFYFILFHSILILSCPVLSCSAIRSCSVCFGQGPLLHSCLGRDLPGSTHFLSHLPTCHGDAVPIKQACADVSAWLHKPALENLSSWITSIAGLSVCKGVRLQNTHSQGLTKTTSFLAVCEGLFITLQQRNAGM